ncbi:RAMP superfamily CRISPR-associated protein [Propionicicella superfundia]|uniref:RAMP superfamily CRISPR-associated protein n=1 Tax=Propionicicella superfundia TaxID=348582 RepID=UPI00040121C4|nr:RAMP superfamily CRISPR-associated protein [Propionicicella superfundia]
MTARLDQVSLAFTIRFHGPFHVGTGRPEPGLDNAVDRDTPLPASSLKGLMRAAARESLGVRETLVDDVFGKPRQPAPWWWSDAQFAVPIAVTSTTRISVDDATGLAKRGFLMFGEHAWAEPATFCVEPRVRLSDEQYSVHSLVLRAAALAVLGLGGGRRRGEGWVSIEDDGEPWTDADSERLIAARVRVP